MKEHGICAKCKKSVGCPYADDRIKGCKKFMLEKELELNNKEYMRSCSSDELAEFLWKIVSEYILWDKMHEPQYGGNPKQAFIDWLEEKHNE